MKVFLEYVWLDGNQPQQFRSKTKVVNYNGSNTVYPNWSFDGSSTNQAESGENKNTDCVLKPVFICKDPFRGSVHKLVFCEVYNSDGETPHPTNNRHKLSQLLDSLGLEKGLTYDQKPWFGWEQEYTLTHKPFNPFGNGYGLPLGFSVDSNKTPRPQGDYYCGVGHDSVIGREIVEEHLNACDECGLEVSGLNAEVLLGQWEYQIGPVTALNGSDQLWVSRYLLQRVAEKHGVNVSLHPKPKKGPWNGSGCHVNFSNKEMRSEGGLDVILSTMDRLAEKHTEHIINYGLFNEERLSGDFETSDINKFSYGFSTRDTSIRIPIQTKLDGMGYFEDRRPSSNCDPYMVSLKMLETIYNTVYNTVSV